MLVWNKSLLDLKNILNKPNALLGEGGRVSVLTNLPLGLLA